MKPFVGEKIILSDIERKTGELTIGVSTCADIEALLASNNWNWSKSDLVTKGHAEVYAIRFGSDVVYQPPIHIFTQGIMLKLYVDDACSYREIELYEFAK